MLDSFLKLPEIYTFLAVYFPGFLREVPNQKAFSIIFTAALEDTISLQ